MTIEVVFFDAGETLLRAEPSFPERAAQVLRSRGHDVRSEDVVRASRAVSHHFRQASDEGRVFSASAEESRAFWTTFYVDMMSDLQIDDDGAPEALFTVFSDPSSYALFDDTLPTLSALRDRGLRLGVISNFESWLRDLLSRLRILDDFEVVAISGDLGYEKPDPRIFKWALEEAGAEAPACVHVGDQPYFDAEAAAACGIHGVVLDRYDRWADVEGFPRIGSLRELPDVIARLGVDA